MRIKGMVQYLSQGNFRLNFNFNNATPAAGGQQWPADS